MKNVVRAPLALTAATLAVAAFTLPAHASDSADSPVRSVAVGCYESAGKFASYPGSGSSNAYYPARGTYRSVRGYCNDINVKLESTRKVRVCTVNKCHPWVTASKNTWTVVFKNSVWGAGYYLQFKGTAVAYGWLAD